MDFQVNEKNDATELVHNLNVNSRHTRSCLMWGKYKRKKLYEVLILWSLIYLKYIFRYNT